MQKYKRLIFPALSLCLLLFLGGFFLGRRTRGTVLSGTRTPPDRTVQTETAAPRETGDRETEPRGRVDLNAATLEELIALPGIGPTLAQRILDYRAENGPFRETGDLLNVSGIGEGILAGLQDLIYVEVYHEDSDR